MALHALPSYASRSSAITETHGQVVGKPQQCPLSPIYNAWSELHHPSGNLPPTLPRLLQCPGENYRRARADDGDKASEALAAADSLQAALLVENREHALATASAAELAASTERRHKRELDRLDESHAAAVEDVRVSFDEEIKTLQQEATETLSGELAQEKEHAAEDKCRLRREWEEAAKFERDR